MNWKVPYFQLELGEEEERAVLAVVRSNWLTAGPRVAEFEQRFSKALGDDVQAVAVSNCTAALHLAMVTLGIGPGDEVIVPSLTFVATANAVRYVGATPVFADICSTADWNLDPVDVERRLSDQTRAVIVMHYGGYPCRMAQFADLSRRRELKLVEDAAHAPLVQVDGRKLGTIGEVGCFSFFSNKNMSTGEGGMLVTRDPAVAGAARTLRSHGMSSGSYERYRGHAFGYDVIGLGYNYRMDEIHAAIGMEQLKKLPGKSIRRREIVRHYRKAISVAVPTLSFPFRDWDGDSGYHIFPVLLPEGVNRAEVMDRLAECGIQTSIHYRPAHTLTAYAGTAAHLPNTDAISARILSLPLYPSLTAQDVDYVADSLARCLA